MASGPPPFRRFLGEARFVAEWWAGRRYSSRFEGRAGGGGQTVLVIPGFLASDWMTGPLRRALASAGHDVHGWGLGRNYGLRSGVYEGVRNRVAELARDSGAPIMIIGWSLGGLYAREIAKRMPDEVARVITLGSPFSGDIRANRAWRLYERVAGHSVDAPPVDVQLPVKPPQPTYAFWSRGDGICSPDSCCGLEGQADMAIEIECSHLGFVCSPAAIEAVLKALA